MRDLTPEQRAELYELREWKEKRLRKARETSRLWRLKNPYRVNLPAKEKDDKLKILEHHIAIIEKAKRDGDLSVYDPSMDQIM